MSQTPDMWTKVEVTISVMVGVDFEDEMYEIVRVDPPLKADLMNAVEDQCGTDIEYAIEENTP